LQTEADWGYYKLSLAQDTETGKFRYNEGSMLSVLSVVGGFGMSVFSICFMCLEGYQNFAYEKSAFKLLFFEDGKE